MRKIKRTLFTLLFGLSGLSCADRMQVSYEANFPRSSREEEVTNLVGKVIGDVRTFKDESETFEVGCPAIQFEYLGNRFFENGFMDRSLFYWRLSYNEGEVDTTLHLSEFEIGRTSFCTGVGVKSFIFPVDEKRKINLGLDLRADYYIGEWEGRYKTLFGNISLSGTDQGFGFYTGAVIEGDLPDLFGGSLKGLDTKWTVFGGYNHARFGDFSDFRGPVFGVGAIVSVD